MVYFRSFQYGLFLKPFTKTDVTVFNILRLPVLKEYKYFIVKSRW